MPRPEPFARVPYSGWMFVFGITSRTPARIAGETALTLGDEPEGSPVPEGCTLGKLRGAPVANHEGPGPQYLCSRGRRPPLFGLPLPDSSPAIVRLGTAPAFGSRRGFSLERGVDTDPVRGDLFYLKGDPDFENTELAGGNLEYANGRLLGRWENLYLGAAESGRLGVTYLRAIVSDERGAERRLRRDMAAQGGTPGLRRRRSLLDLPGLRLRAVLSDRPARSATARSRSAGARGIPRETREVGDLRPRQALAPSGFATTMYTTSLPL
jgi:hypothetical protein